jgi:DNA-binding NarL/FixJ family response regulator
MQGESVAYEESEIGVLLSLANAMTGEVLSLALNRHAAIRVVSRVTSAAETLSVVRGMPVDVAVIGAALEEGELNGLEVVRELHKSAPQVKTILMLDSPDQRLIVEAFRAGARGVFRPTQSSFKQLCRCVMQVHAGQIWARSDELGAVLDVFSRQAGMKVVNSNGLSLLTKREDDVVRLLAEGYQNREIARELHLSEHTVKNYLFRVFEKLGISSRVELVLYALSSMTQDQMHEPSSLAPVQQIPRVSGSSK